MDARLLVKDRQKAADLLSGWAEEHKGYFTVKTLEKIEFRVPDRAAEDLMPYLEEISEEVVEYNRTARTLENSF